MSIKCENCGRPTHVLSGSRLVICHVACTIEEALSSKEDIATFVEELFEQKKETMKEFLRALLKEMERKGLEP